MTPIVKLDLLNLNDKWPILYFFLISYWNFVYRFILVGFHNQKWELYILANIPKTTFLTTAVFFYEIDDISFKIF